MVERFLPLAKETTPATQHQTLGALAAPGLARGSSSMRVLRISVAIWIVYLLALAAIDQVVVVVRPGARMLPSQYYILQGLSALIGCGLVWSPWLPARLGRSFLPTVIVSMSALPLLLPPLLLPNLHSGPLTSVDGLLEMRMLPVVSIALVLVAWQYRWRHVVLFTMGAAAMMLLSIVLRGSAFGLGIALTLIQATGLLTFGCCIRVVTKRLHAQSAALALANTQLRHYASTLESLTISRERNRVSRELHDTLAHTLSSMIVHLETTKAYWQVDPQSAGPLLDTALEVSRSGLQETRRAIKALRTSPLDELGLRQALVKLAAGQAATANLHLDLSISEQLPALPPDVEQGIYRIAQEAIANTARHAAARHLAVRLAYVDQRLRLAVQDDGCGFDLSQSLQPGHFGLAGIRERAEITGGQLSISSAPGQGTTVQLVIEWEVDHAASAYL
jgi:signal transduction histidine kinase